MPIFCDEISTSGSGRSVMFSPEIILWIESAASWPCATAQMMFFGPNAASPPKNTFGLVEPNVFGSTLGMFHLSNSMPQSRSIHGKAFSWPTATSTSSHSMVWSGSPDGTRLRLPLVSYSALTFWKVTPVSLPLSWVKATGTMKLRIGMSSCMASSFSQGEAFISSKPDRTTTLTSSPPRRRAGRAASDENRIVIIGEQLLHALDALTALELDAEAQDVAGLLVDHGIGQAEFRNLAPHHAAGLGVGIEHRAVIAERREIARHRERGRTTTDQRDALAVLRSRLRQLMPDVVLE